MVQFCALTHSFSVVQVSPQMSPSGAVHTLANLLHPFVKLIWPDGKHIVASILDGVNKKLLGSFSLDFL